MARGRRARGFTTIEVLIAVLVVGVLAAVALPSFLAQMRKGRRSEAVAALSALQQAEEKWRSSNAGYTDDLSSTGLNFPTTTPNGYYTIAVRSATADGYVATATAVPGSAQGGDTPCVKMAVQMDKGTLRYGSGAGASNTTLSDDNQCWAK